MRRRKSEIFAARPCENCGRDDMTSLVPIRLGHTYPPGVVPPLDLLPDERTEWVCDLCELKLTGQFFAGDKARLFCPAGHKLPEPTIGRAICPACVQAAGRSLPTCILCGDLEPDYTTHILVQDHGKNLGHLRVTAHIDCLLQKGGTKWVISETPQLTKAHLEDLLDLTLDDAIRAYTTDLCAFNAQFHALRDEIETKTSILRHALRYFSTGIACWYGIQRPVDLLATIRARWAEIEATEPHKLFVQCTLF